ncbi:hypothetical protein ACERK3_11735 [Phycisphaerales bacterium AB-hyl4]|uniref:Uncharacterized protein n=1 Tax=Natronomicrosphaera hydrolytica TaxID=3242702 RepID=A0ABV4U5Z9_9BACT
MSEMCLRRLGHLIEPGPIAERLLVELDDGDLIDWDLWHIDGSSIRGSRAAGGAAAKSLKKGPPNRRTTRWAAAEAGSARSCT